MNTLALKVHGGNQRCAEEKILIRAYHTSEALKDAIRKVITNYGRMGWKTVNILRDRQFIRLIIKQFESEG